MALDLSSEAVRRAVAYLRSFPTSTHHCPELRSGPVRTEITRHGQALNPRLPAAGYRSGQPYTRLRAEIASLHEQLARQLGAARTATITRRIENVVDMSTTPRS